MLFLLCLMGMPSKSSTKWISWIDVHSSFLEVKVLICCPIISISIIPETSHVGVRRADRRHRRLPSGMTYASNMYREIYITHS